jgi:hypothetical protein
MEMERRRSPRYPFIAAIEITEVLTSTVVRARTSELSRYGCYVDTMNPLPLDTMVQVSITHEGSVFKAGGRVIYDQLNMGMGIAFLGLASQHEQILERWLEELRKKG